MEAPKNNQSARMGDTATVEQADVASFMVPEVVKKDVNVSKGGSAPKTSGVATPGNPAA
jgi:hypothetical protein